MVLFNWNDTIRKSGLVTELSINFAKPPEAEPLPHFFLYIVSTTKDKNRFVIIHRHQIPDEQIRELINIKSKLRSMPQKPQNSSVG